VKALDHKREDIPFHVSFFAVEVYVDSAIPPIKDANNK